MEKYSINPIMSLEVVIKGPVANAGSILYLCKISGTQVPNTAAKIITAQSDILTEMLSRNESLKARLKSNSIKLQSIALSSPTPNSLISLLAIVP